jgi:hypothetical protein
MSNGWMEYEEEGEPLVEGSGGTGRAKKKGARAAARKKAAKKGSKAASRKRSVKKSKKKR